LKFFTRVEEERNQRATWNRSKMSRDAQHSAKHLKLTPNRKWQMAKSKKQNKIRRGYLNQSFGQKWVNPFPKN
jgi:hypothetical protein